MPSTSITWLQNIGFKTLVFANITLSICSVLGYLAPYISPEHFFIPTLLALASPYLLLSHICCIILWIRQRNRWVYCSLFTLALGLGQVFSFLGFTLTTPKYPLEKKLRLLSYNVQYFNNSKYSSDSERKEAITQLQEYIQEINPDIFCAQEFSGRKVQDKERILQALEQNQNLNYHFAAGGSSLIILSKYPIVNSGSLDFPNSYNGAIFADIQIYENTYRVYSMHLQSIRLGSDEQEVFAQENLSSITSSKTKSKYRRIGSKLRKAFILRAQQINRLCQHMDQSPYPILLCGDLNDTHSSYAYHQLQSRLEDSFLKKGWGWGSTHNGSIPFLRIDYIFTPPQIQLYSYQRGDKRLSDHYPIWVDLAISK